MTYKSYLDFDGDCDLHSFLSTLERFGNPRVVSYTADGPGGGNPYVGLEWESEDDARRFVAFHYGYDSPEEVELV